MRSPRAGIFEQVLKEKAPLDAFGSGAIKSIDQFESFPKAWRMGFMRGSLCKGAEIEQHVSYQEYITK